MIAADTSILVDWLRHGPRDRPDVEALMTAMKQERLILPPVVVAELMSFPKANPPLRRFLGQTARLPLTDGFWKRAGASRRRLRLLGLKAKLPDALIAQCCIDTDVPLITRDADFRHFAEHCGLKLAVALK